MRLLTSRNRHHTYFLLVVAALAGCAETRANRTLAVTEPPLLSGSDGATVVQAPPARSVTFMDRHPLFTKPRQYYDSTQGNTAVKTAGATVFGVPAGIVGELRQIIRGNPNAGPAAIASQTEFQPQDNSPVARLGSDVDR